MPQFGGVSPDRMVLEPVDDDRHTLDMLVTPAPGDELLHYEYERA